VPVNKEALESRVQADARKVRGAFGRLRAGFAAGVLAMHAAATLGVTYVVFSEAFPYPVMYPLMGILLWLFLAFRFLAQATGRRVRAAALVVFNLLLTAFWVFVLADQVPARRVVVEGRLVERDPLPVLYIPVALYLLAAVAMLVQTVLMRLRQFAGR